MNGINTCQGCSHYEDGKCKIYNRSPEISISGYPVPIGNCTRNQELSHDEWLYYNNVPRW